MAGEADVVETIIAMREAGRVVRCHTMICHERPNLATHCHNMVGMLLVLHPNPHLQLIQLIQTHDFPERWIGDMPAPAKDNLGIYLAALENRVCDYFGIQYSYSEEEWWWLKALDKLDLLLWGKDELAMGNKNVVRMIGIVEEWFVRQKRKIPGPVMEFVENHRWRRLSDVVPG